MTEDLPTVDPTASWKRKMMWDIIPCDRVEQFMPKMGVTPASAEGEKVEHRLSHERLDTLAPILGVLTQLGILGGEVAVRAILENQGNDDPDPAFVAQYAMVGAAVSRAVIGNLIELGLIDITGGVYRGLLG